MNGDATACLRTAPDADCSTLHIRCGSDILTGLRTAGFSGDFLEYADPLCQGPVPEGPDLLKRRARFLADAFGAHMGFTAAQSLARLTREEQRLNEAHTYQRVVLWFEHDSHDQLILARCLAHFADRDVPARLELICIDRHVSVEHFLGLGQLAPEALASLWPERIPVAPAQLDLGRAVWSALRRTDPSDLAAVAASGTPALPLTAPALRRHLQELPHRTDGLSMTERLVLHILADGPTSIGQVFAALLGGREPLPFLGDLGFLHVVEQMALARQPAIVIKAGESPFRRLAMITNAGRDVLAGRTDYLALVPPERWVGGAKADGRWRCDENAAAIPGINPGSAPKR